MDFFASQNKRKRQSLIVLLFFIAAMLAMAVIVHVVAVLISLPSDNPNNFTEPSTPAKAFIALIWAICLLGCFFRVLDVRAGGVALAKRYGAVAANTARRCRDEQELLDIVCEIAVASSCATPSVFVLHHEHSINAFVLGGFSEKEALVVTQGAIDKLDRNQIAAVVAHEFGHISQGDVSLNMRLLVALSGLNAIDEVGKLLMVEVDGELMVQPAVVVGFIIRAIGSVGVFFGKTVSSAFSRQREYLADACAVQYTRSTEYLASALWVVWEDTDVTGIHGVHSEELAHLCFSVDAMQHWLSNLHATHPPVKKRIDAIDPNFEIKWRSKRRAIQSNKPTLYRSGRGSAAVPISGQRLNTTSAPSDFALLTLTDTVSCLALLHALFVNNEPGKARAFYNVIAAAYSEAFAENVKSISKTLNVDIENNRLSLINATTAQLLQTLSLEKRRDLIKNLKNLLHVEGEISLMNYAALKLIGRKLEAELSIVERKNDESNSNEIITKVKSFDSMGKEFALLLSLIIEASDQSTEAMDEQFEAALRCYTKESHLRRSACDEGIVAELEASFQTLFAQPSSVRMAFVRHCLELVQADGHVAGAEFALLNLFAASLNCDAFAA